MAQALVATLGTEPQVVLLALQLLTLRGASLRCCAVLHTRSSSPALRAALERLQQEWPRWAPTVPLELHPIPIEDLDSEKALQCAYRAVREAIQALKNAGMTVHLCISGGRKPLALVAFLTAQFLFGPNDRLWYLYSPPGTEKTDPSHLLRDPRVQLLEMPVPLWTELPLFLQAVGRYRDPWTAAFVQRALVRQGEKSRLAHFFQQKLTPAEQSVVRALVLHGGTNRELGKILGKSPRTVGHQLRSVYRKVRAELGPEVVVDRTAIASLFAPLLRA